MLKISEADAITALEAVFNALMGDMRGRSAYQERLKRAHRAGRALASIGSTPWVPSSAPRKQKVMLEEESDHEHQV